MADDGPVTDDPHPPPPPLCPKCNTRHNGSCPGNPGEDEA